MKKYSFLLFAFVLVSITGLMAFRRGAPGSQPHHAEARPCFLFLSDIHLNTQSKTTAPGGDTGMDLWKAFLDKVDVIMHEDHAPSFIVYSGDLPAHYACIDSCYLPPSERAGHNKNITTVISALQKMAEQYHKPVFYLPGNNDALAGDYYSFADEQQRTPLSLVPAAHYFFPDAHNHAVYMQAPCMISEPHPTMGYYSAYPVRGLRLVALNTVMYTSKFRAVDGTDPQKDGATQMEWLAAQLAEAEAKHEKVYIAMHVPPGLDAYSSYSMWVQVPGNKNSWLNTFLRLTTRYQSIIAGILYGHTHMDEVRRLYDSTGTHITEVAISCPGVTPQHYNNPGFKTVQYDAVSKQLMDFTTYYTHTGQQYWGDSTYSFSKVYGSSPGMSVYECLSNMQLPAVGNCMNSIFTVKNGAPTYNTVTGIEVKTD